MIIRARYYRLIILFCFGYLEELLVSTLVEFEDVIILLCFSLGHIEVNAFISSGFKMKANRIFDVILYRILNIFRKFEYRIRIYQVNLQVLQVSHYSSFACTCNRLCVMALVNLYLNIRVNSAFIITLDIVVMI